MGVNRFIISTFVEQDAILRHEIKKRREKSGRRIRTPLSPKRIKIPKTARVSGGKSNQTRDESLSFFYPDCYCRLWNYTSIVPYDRFKSVILARGLYRRSGIAPCPEGLYSVGAIITQTLLQLRFDLLGGVFVACEFVAFFLHERGGGFIGEVARQ